MLTYLVDGPVCCEPFAVLSPDHQGKYREFSLILVVQGRISIKNTLSSLRFLSKFPTQWNRELFVVDREFQFPDPISIRDVDGLSGDSGGATVNMIKYRNATSAGV
jgi:hypothetical protein